MKIILCAGDRKIDGFITHDIQGEQDIVCDIRDILKAHSPAKASSFEEIHFTHALEHFATKEVPDILDIVYALAAPGAKIYIEVPNFEWHAKLVLNEHRDRDAVYYAFGGQLDEYDFHKTAFTETILREELENAGFQDIEIKNNSSLEAWMKK